MRDENQLGYKMVKFNALDLGVVEHITMHHCVQGWSGIAKWGGIPMRNCFSDCFSFGEALYGGPYYDTQSLEKKATTLASGFGRTRSISVRHDSGLLSEDDEYFDLLPNI
jgi:hypothetical protein